MAQKAQMTLKPMGGEAAEELVSKLLTMSPDLVKETYDYTHTE